MVTGTEVYKMSMMVDHHVSERERGGDPSPHTRASVCIEWLERVRMCAYCGEKLERGQGKCPCLPINCTPQGLAKLLKHTPLSTYTLAVLLDATKGSSESVLIC